MTTIDAYRGATLRLTVTTANVPDGSTVTFMAKRDAGDLDAAAALTTTGTVTNNAAALVIPATDMALLTAPSTLVWEVQTVVGGNVCTLDAGYLNILPDVVRATS